ncbi:EPIDERMAL PATTERNING FACTOR-like protein 2 [Phragmites australis]|uniref:EPIDERMAL PATTERNING FACTOR-like protein 2 n=1 Tax=Phragmites australis TaxID=29695 RepID=UPI002D793806|nr:EPIDERMAL PATTERNING FACTOR-like protein 2 [Phragmites australis]
MGHHLVLLTLALLQITTTHATGRAQAAAITQETMGVGSMMRSMVGSRPPSCEGRCLWCGGRRCEAVQVPITPQELQMKKRGQGHGHGRGGPRSRGAGGGSHSLKPSSYDDHSNYKPLSWRCKCGSVLLNP